MDVGLALRDDLHAELGQLVHDSPDRHFVAGDDARRKDDRITVAKLQLVRAPGNPPQRRARFALPARSDDQHF